MTTTPIVDPFLCPPLGARELDEYQALADLDEYLFESGDQTMSPALRAWVREADKACRANAALTPQE